VNKRSAILVAAGLVVSLATGFVAFLNGGLGPAADAVTRPTSILPQAHTPSSAESSMRASGTALADRRAADHDD
jgi:hypothetical protein